MRNRVGTRAETSVDEHNHTCSPMMSGMLSWPLGGLRASSGAIAKEHIGNNYGDLVP